MRKSIICGLLMTSTLLVSAGAAHVETSDIVAIREDIPRAEAVLDPTFNPALSNEDYTSLQPRAVTWDVWGEKVYTTIDHSSAKPVGYSAHMDGSTVLSTYHYTRTFLGSAGDVVISGDSGRKWGTYTVKAEGISCMEDVWRDLTHKVYYGTEA